jgi:RimJ/RimL family protein N-acetyltransferase
LLGGKTVNLRVEEKEDMRLVAEWVSNLGYFGEYIPLTQESRTAMEKGYDTMPPETRWFIIEKKDRSKIGSIGHFPAGKAFEIGYAIIPSERGKGYCTEALKIMVDYMFLSKTTVRVQAHADTRNTASQRVLEKAGFEKEGTVRKLNFIRGEWRDSYLYSILREEWREPRILTRTASES